MSGNRPAPACRFMVGLGGERSSHHIAGEVEAAQEVAQFLLAYVWRCGPAITKAAAYTLMAKVARNTKLTLFIRFFSFYSRVAVAGKQIEDKLRANRSIEAAGHA